MAGVCGCNGPAGDTAPGSPSGGGDGAADGPPEGWDLPYTPGGGAVAILDAAAPTVSASSTHFLADAWAPYQGVRAPLLAVDAQGRIVPPPLAAADLAALDDHLDPGGLWDLAVAADGSVVLLTRGYGAAGASLGGVVRVEPGAGVGLWSEAVGPDASSIAAPADGAWVAATDGDGSGDAAADGVVVLDGATGDEAWRWSGAALEAVAFDAHGGLVAASSSALWAWAPGDTEPVTWDSAHPLHDVERGMDGVLRAASGDAEGAAGQLFTFDGAGGEPAVDTLPVPATQVDAWADGVAVFASDRAHPGLWTRSPSGAVSQLVDGLTGVVDLVAVDDRVVAVTAAGRLVIASRTGALTEIVPEGGVLREPRALLRLP